MKTLFLALAALVFSVQAAPAQTMTPAETKLYEAAKQEGKLTWYVAQFTTETADSIARDFSKRYPGVGVDVIRASGQVVFARLTQDQRAGVAQCDVFSGTGVAQLDELKQGKKLLHFKPENADKLNKQFIGFDPDGYYYANHFEPIVISYNTNQLKGADVPTKWTALIDPKMKGRIALSDPGFSGQSGEWAVLMRRLYGDEFFKTLAKQDPLIGRSMNDPLSVVASGERALGVTGLSQSQTLARAGNPVAVAYPEDGVKATPLATGIPANAPHPNAAQLFVNHLLSKGLWEMLVRDYSYLPIRPDVAPLPGARPLDAMTVAPLSTEEVVTKVPEIVEVWRDIFGG